MQLLRQIATGGMDAALVTLPAENPELSVEALRRDRLVACLRADHPLAAKAVLRTEDLHDQLRIFYHVQGHPEAHARLMEQLRVVGIPVGDFSSASHPIEMQQLVKEGFGMPLMREGTPLEPELTTRPILGVDWTVDTAFVYHKKRHLATIPILVRHLKKHFSPPLRKHEVPAVSSKVEVRNGGRKRPPRSDDKGPEQLLLLG
jgi:DNA-binding transcriptional LysR family regulator